MGALDDWRGRIKETLRDGNQVYRDGFLDGLQFALGVVCEQAVRAVDHQMVALQEGCHSEADIKYLGGRVHALEDAEQALAKIINGGEEKRQ